MRVMALFQLHFLSNACVWVKMAPGRGHLCHIDTFLVLFLLENICCMYSLEVPEALLMSTLNICFSGEVRKLKVLFN